MTSFSSDTAPAVALQNAFATPDTAQWKAAAEQALKGADFERTLYKKSYEGLTYQGLYTTRPRQEIQMTPRAGWQVCQRYRDPDATRGLQEIAYDQQQGLEAAEFDGRICDQAHIRAILEQAPLHIPLYFRAHSLHPDLCEAELPLQGFLIDPMTDWLEGYTESPVAAYKALHQQFKLQSERPKPLRYLMQISSMTCAEAGANAVQELSYILGACVEAFQRLLDHRVPCPDILSATRIEMSVGTQFFMDVAKIRALRFLLHRLARVYACESQPMTLHATTLKRTLGRYDIHNNYLRQTLGASAAVLGGVDSLSTGAFNEVNGLPDRTARRMARNIQLVLKHEAYFETLLDPARGSFFLENLTSELAEAAWKQFQGIEQQGGLEMELRSGRLQQSILEVAALRQKAFNTRKDVVVGINQYAPAQEKRHNTHLLPTSQVPDYQVETNIEALPPLRPALAFETLRENDFWDQQQVTLLCYGDAYRPRAEFMEGIFACVGLRPEHSPALETPEALVAYVGQRIEAPSLEAETPPEDTEASHTGAQHLMVFCASDSAYTSLLPKVLPRLKEAYPQLQLILAGNPGEQHAAYQKLGLSTAFYRGCNVLSALTHLLPKA